MGGLSMLQHQDAIAKVKVKDEPDYAAAPPGLLQHTGDDEEKAKESLLEVAEEAKGTISTVERTLSGKGEKKYEEADRQQQDADGKKEDGTILPWGPVGAMNSGEKEKKHPGPPGHKHP